MTIFRVDNSSDEDFSQKIDAVPEDAGTSSDSDEVQVGKSRVNATSYNVSPFIAGGIGDLTTSSVIAKMKHT